MSPALWLTGHSCFICFQSICVDLKQPRGANIIQEVNSSLQLLVYLILSSASHWSSFDTSLWEISSFFCVKRKTKKTSWCTTHEQFLRPKLPNKGFNSAYLCDSDRNVWWTLSKLGCIYFIYCDIIKFCWLSSKVCLCCYLHLKWTEFTTQTLTVESQLSSGKRRCHCF